MGQYSGKCFILGVVFTQKEACDISAFLVLFRHMENIEKEPSVERMDLPEIVVEEEKGLQLLSVLFKAGDSEWGEKEHPLAKDVVNYFKNNPSSAIDAIKELRQENIDEETLYNLALTYDHPEREKEVFEVIEKYKPDVENPREVHEKVLATLRSFEETFSASPLSEKLKKETEKDKEKREEKMGETKERILHLINFFKPDKETTNIKKVNLSPTDPLFDANSGRSFSASPREQIVMSHVDNDNDMEHEFLHGIINPIVEKLSEKLTEEEKEKISEMTSGSLRMDYGDDFFSLLCEEIIRTYNIFKKGENLPSVEGFKKELSRATEKQFEEGIKNKSAKKKCEMFGIETLSDLQEKSEEWFDCFQKSELREIVFQMYKEYAGSDENFEQYFLESFRSRL